MSLTFPSLTPNVLNNLSQYLHQWEAPSNSSILSLQDIIELFLALPIIIGLGYIVPFLGWFSPLALVLVVFFSWRLGTIISNAIQRNHQNRKALKTTIPFR